MISPAGPPGLAASGPGRVVGILALYTDAAASTHVLLTLTLDLLFPVAGVVFGWIASRNLRAVLSAGRAIAIVGIVLSIGYGVSELAENALELSLLLGATGTPVAGGAAATHVIKNGIAGLLLAYIAAGYGIAYVRRRMRRPAMVVP